jgi:hypothetical protein
MWWSDEVIPAWVTRVSMLVTVTLFATAAAFAGFWLLTVAELAQGQLLEASLSHPVVVVAAAVGCGAVIGAAAASARPGAGLRRGAGTAGIVGLLAVAAVGVYLVASTEREKFETASFRQAMAEQDDSTLQSQAAAAVDSGALIGLSATSLRRTLGAPSRIERHGRRYIWELGEVKAFFFATTATLYVDFDAKGRRVETAEVYEPED